MEQNNDRHGLRADVKLNMTPGNIKKGMKAIGTPNDMYMVDARKVRVIPDFNPRIKDEKYWEGIRELALGMKTHGYYRDKPLAGYVAVEDGEEVVYLTEGHRRHDAVLYWQDNLDAPEDLRIPFVPKPRGTSDLDLTYALLESNKAQDFRPFELAMLVKRLHVAYGQSEAVIAEKMNKSLPYVRHMLLVAGAPDDIVKMVIAEELSITEAADAINTYKDKAVDVLTKAKANSAAEGKKKVSKRFMPGMKFQTAVKKEAPAILDAVRQVSNDEGFGNLTEQTRSTISDLVSRLGELEAKLAEKEARAQARVDDGSVESETE